ncbi:MAG: TonB-dependent receptor [Ignavibacteria bacterium]|nr:TonB-dependent receptor [Ignavibacteria bacterium]
MKKVIIYLLCFTAVLLGQNTGTVFGKVTDAKTGEPLIGVSVALKGTYYGAQTAVNGEFKIKNINPGTYNMEVSYIGYSTMQFTGVKIEAGKNKEYNVKLEESILTIDKNVIVIGEKPMMDVEETQSKRTINKDDIAAAKLENISDVVTQQAGVVKSDNEIHIRGGRSYENAFLLDGVSVQDPLAGTGFGLQLSANAIEDVEVITGGYNAEFGQATSGVVNVRTKEGGDKYHGSFSYKTDRLASTTNTHVFNTDVYEASFSGPIFKSKTLGDFNFFLNGYVGLTDGIAQGMQKATAHSVNSSIFYGTRFAPRAENSLFYLAKLTWKPTPTFRVQYSFNQSVNINQNSQSLQQNLEYVEPSPGFQYNFMKILDSANTFTHNAKYQTLSITHTLNPKTFYELKFNYFFTHLRADANGKEWYNYNEPKDITNYPVILYNTSGHDTIGVIPGDGFWDVGNPYTWHDHYVQEYSVKGDLTSFFDTKNKFKAGFDFQFQEMQVIDIYQPWIKPLGLNNDMYIVNPAKGSFYAQDNINFSGMILNFGLRFDYWFPGKLVDDAVDNPDVITIPQAVRDSYKDHTFNLFGHRWKGRLSPRLGISHPVSDYQTLFFSYGHFSKWPNPQFVYAKLTPVSAQSSFQKFGNPDLDPETTVAYELGLKTQFTENDVLTVTTYYKDIFDYVSTRSAIITTSRLSTQSLTTYINSDYARSRGLEVEYKKRLGKWFTGSFNFAYSIVTGKSSSPDEGVLVQKGSLQETIKEFYMSWDRPLNISLSTNFYVEKNNALFGFGDGILDDYNIFIRFQFESGKRYTPAVFSGVYYSDGRPEYLTIQTDRNNKIGENWFWVDLNFEKNFQVSGMKFSIFAEVQNLLDNYNAAIINPATGKAYELGQPTPSSWNDPLYPDLQAPISAYPFNPARYLTRRNIKVGISLKF